MKLLILNFRWLSHFDASPGFSEEAFENLQKKCEASTDGHVEVSLIIDSMAIRKHISWDSRRQCFFGYVDYGSGVDLTATEEATEALVFMVVGIFSHWKQPIAYFLTRGLPGHALTQLLTHALERLYEIGVTVVTLTLDGHQANQAAVKQLGVSLKGDIRSFFPHPSNPEVEVCVMFDACHMIKLVRNSLHALSKLQYL